MKIRHLHCNWSPLPGLTTTRKRSNPPYRQNWSHQYPVTRAQAVISDVTQKKGTLYPSLDSDLLRWRTNLKWPSMGNISLSAEPQAGELWLHQTFASSRGRLCWLALEALALHWSQRQLSFKYHPPRIITRTFSFWCWFKVFPLFKIVQVHFQSVLDMKMPNTVAQRKTPKTKSEEDLEMEQVSWLQCHPGEVPQHVTLSQLTLGNAQRENGQRLNKGHANIKGKRAAWHAWYLFVKPQLQMCAPKISTAL